MLDDDDKLGGVAEIEEESIDVLLEDDKFSNETDNSASFSGAVVDDAIAEEDIKLTKSKKIFSAGDVSEGELDATRLYLSEIGIFFSSNSQGRSILFTVVAKRRR